jgi:hypothetical protein
VISDSDLHVPVNYLERLVAELAKPGTGLVTALYVGARPAAKGWAAALGATQISHDFLPGVLMSRAMGRAAAPTAPVTVREALRLIWLADKYPIRGNEDWRVAASSMRKRSKRLPRECRGRTIRRNSPNGSQPSAIPRSRTMCAKGSCRRFMICSIPRSKAGSWSPLASRPARSGRLFLWRGLLACQGVSPSWGDDAPTARTAFAGRAAFATLLYERVGFSGMQNSWCVSFVPPKGQATNQRPRELVHYAIPFWPTIETKA